MLVLPLPTSNSAREARAYPWGQDTIVVHDRVTNASYGRHSAPLSIKTVKSGAESYNIHGFFDRVTTGRYLIVNDGQEYESVIDEPEPVETLCVFFSGRDVTCALHSWESDELLLSGSTGRSIEFSSVALRIDPLVARHVIELPSLAQAPSLRQQEAVQSLLRAMFRTEKALRGKATNIPCVRASTREELQRRCLVGLAYMDAHWNEDVTLEDLAAVAGLSQGHFLRAFTQCFGLTPSKALRRRRLDHAADALRVGGQSVTEVALSCGYTNHSAFTRAFSALHGVAPSIYAKARER
jgi:AraC-like DNA-binding protein